MQPFITVIVEIEIWRLKVKYMEIKSTYPVHGGHGTVDGERSIFHDEKYT